MEESITSLSSLTQDSKNANVGTARGLEMLRDSLSKLGAGRSIVLDRDGRIIAGNKTAQAAALVGLDDVIVVKTDGKRIVAVQRTDLDLDSPEGRQLALADNRVGEVGLFWDPNILAELHGDGLDISGLFSGTEIDALLGELSAGPSFEQLPIPSATIGNAGYGIGAPAIAPPAGSEQGPSAAPAPTPASGGVPAPRPLGPQGPPSAPVPPQGQAGQPSAEAPVVQFKEFDESVAAGVTIHQCPACGNRWAE